MQAARDPVWEQLSYSLCKYAKWNEIVRTHRCLASMTMSIHRELTSRGPTWVKGNV